MRDFGFRVGEFETPLRQEAFHERSDFIFQKSLGCARDNEVIRIASQMGFRCAQSALRLIEVLGQQSLKSIQSRMALSCARSAFGL
jgi:hypothetical protein